MKCSAVLLALVACVSALDVDVEFGKYVKQFGKQYTPAEYTLRRQLFAETLARVTKHNANPKKTHSLGLNEFADMTGPELAGKRGFNRGQWRSHRASGKVPVEASLLKPATDLPTDFSWVDQGVVTPPKNQGSCGSCWAFSGTGTIESNLLFNNQTETSLSEQLYVDCAPNPDDCGGTGGCQGSTQPLLFDYALSAGAELESAYTYTAHDGICKADDYDVVATIEGYGILPENCDDDTLMTYLVEKGPLSISVDASTWSSYTSGVMTFDECGPYINHAVMLVGYGTDEDLGLDYWTIKNSWGTSWGEEGFIRISRDETFANDTAPSDGTGCADGPAWVEVRGTCGILYANSYVYGAALV